MMPSSSHPAPESPVPDAPSTRRDWVLTLLWIVPVLFLLLVFLYGTLSRPSPSSNALAPRVGQPLADFSLPDLHNQMVQLSSLRGKVVFINIWATWCPPCVDEMPTIQRLHDQLHARGLAVLAISLDALGTQVVAPFVRDYRLSFPVLLDARSTIERLYRTSGVPESFIVDKRGRLVEKIVGPRDWAHPQMLALFERLLAASDMDAKSGG
jgi:peroxiredoxin